MAPTGVSPINISGTTVNTALAIPKETGENLPAMSDQKKTQMRVSLSELKLIIIDEVLIISNITLLQHDGSCYPVFSRCYVVGHVTSTRQRGSLSRPC